MNSPGTKLENNGHFVEIDSDGTIDISGTSLKFNGATLAGGALPMGGTTGEALVKASDADGAVTWGDVAAPTVLQHTVTLTDAEIKGLPNTYALLLPDLPVGQMYVPHRVVMVSNFASAYVGPSGATSTAILSANAQWQLGLAGDFGGILLTPANIAHVFGVDLDRVYPSSLTANAFPSTANTNAGLRLGASDNDDFIGGDPANTLKVTIYYSIVNVS